MEISVRTDVKIDAAELANSMSPSEIGEFITTLAGRFDQNAKGRTRFAGLMAEGLSEIGCRFLAEVVTQHYIRSDNERYRE
jgi:hypothetical protein